MQRSTDLDNDQRGWAVATSALILGVLAFLTSGTFGGQKIDLTRPTPTGALADSIFRTYVVAFEVVSMLLLAALVGAIVLARKD
jgi:NADH-quinone oxidoreductase subunit J